MGYAVSREALIRRNFEIQPLITKDFPFFISGDTEITICCYKNLDQNLGFKIYIDGYIWNANGVGNGILRIKRNGVTMASATAIGVGVGASLIYNSIVGLTGAKETWILTMVGTLAGSHNSYEGNSWVTYT